MTDFVVMECHGPLPLARVGIVTDVEDSPWMHGVRVDDPGLVRCSVDPDRPGKLSALYEYLDVPLIRLDLLAQLQAAGVDNLQLFEANIVDPTTGVEHTNYRAFNILGLVSGADMGASQLMHPGSLTGIDHDFASLVFDREKLRPDLLLFRLAESVNAIVVHEKVRRQIEASGIEGMVFYASGEWSG